MSGHDFTLAQGVGVPLLELSKSCILGGCIGYGLSKLLDYIKDKERMFTFSIAAVILTVGLAVLFKLDFILSAMVLGMVFANRSPQVSRNIFESIEKFSPPIFILFFVAGWSPSSGKIIFKYKRSAISYFLSGWQDIGKDARRLVWRVYI